MKYPELSCNVYAEVDGENVLLIEIDRECRKFLKKSTATLKAT